MNQAIPDTANGPLYRAWKRMRDTEIACDCACRAYAKLHAGELASPKPEIVFKPSQQIRIRTVTDAVRQVIATKVNGAPVTRAFLLQETDKLFPCNRDSLNGALNICKGEGLIQHDEKHGHWRKPEMRKDDGA